jgi:hypothetical protein
MAISSDGDMTGAYVAGFLGAALGAGLGFLIALAITYDWNSGASGKGDPK